MKILVAFGLLYLLMIPIFFIAGIVFLIKGTYSETYSSDRSSSAADYGLPKSIYVEEIGRTCYQDGENMYDMESDCWFWWNTDLLPAQWQYWYEGISSDFGDYGWMEYSDDEDKWYIEVADGVWKELKGYNTDGCWHFENAYINNYY